MKAPSTAADYLQIVARSELLPGDVLRRYSHHGDGPATACQMVEDRVLTPFQAEQMLAGRYKGFILAEKYKLLAHLGSGGMGHVYLCEHLLLHRLVAIKRLAPPTEDGFRASTAAARFLREARAVAAVNTPHIVKVFDMDQEGETPFLVMEYIDGTNLHDLTVDHGPLPPKRMVEYIRQAALGLQAIHEAGLVHRDIKPGNLLLDRTGTVRILDLGLARFYADPSKNLNITGHFDSNSVIGTADFIAPEQAYDSTKVDIRSDIYALGCTAYFLLTGVAPFDQGTAAQKLVFHQLKNPSPVKKRNPSIPDSVSDIVGRMMEKEPGKRYATPQELVQTLEKLNLGRVDLPTTEEMPRMPATAYRLGLTPTRSRDAGLTEDYPKPPPSEIFLAPITGNMRSPPTQKRRSRRAVVVKSPEVVTFRHWSTVLLIISFLLIGLVIGTFLFLK